MGEPANSRNVMSSSSSDFDAQLMDWLYGELDASGMARFEAHLDTHPEAKAEAEALQQTRLAFEEFPQAEPPSAMMAMVMHQAATEVQPKAGLWSTIAGFFQPIVLHPAASAMATLVLLAGVAGALYVRNGDMRAEQSAKSSSIAPSTSTASRPALAAKAELADDDKYKYSELAEAEEALSDRGLEPEMPGYAADLATPAQEELIQTAKKTAPKPMVDGVLSRSSADKGDSDDIDNDDVFKSEIAANAISGGLQARDLEPAEKSSEPEFRAKPNRASAPSQAPMAEPKRPSSTLAKKESQKDERLGRDEQQVQRFQAAARSKRCQDAGRIANDLLERNPKVYRSDVKGSPEESDCSYYIASETKRRTRARAKRALATRKKAKPSRRKGQGKSVPSKAKAAPQENQSAL